MLVPMPGIVLDLLLTLSITASVLVLLTAIQVLRPVEFSVFPSLILLLTLMRLSLDLAATRRILLHGSEGPSAAGKVIEAFGQFVVGGNYIVGFVIFLALIAIQYLVVSHGAVRTAEVTARFTLDAMPGKQMAIDSDLNTGLINADQARQRREQVAREAEFCGSMDGAARFSQRDSLATILITAINIVAGFLIGVFQQGMPFQQALKTYTILTVGDGLVVDHSVASGFGGGRHRGHPRRLGLFPGSGYRQADVPHGASAVDCERVSSVAGADSGNAEDLVHRLGRSRDVHRLEDEAERRRCSRGQGRRRKRRASRERPQSIPWTRCSSWTS